MVQFKFMILNGFGLLCRQMQQQGSVWQLQEYASHAVVPQDSKDMLDV